MQPKTSSLPIVAVRRSVQQRQELPAMSFKTLLTITNPELGNAALRVTACLCEEIGAHLSFRVRALAAPPPVGAYAAMVSDVWLEQRQEDLRELEKRSAAVGEYLAGSVLSSD